MDHVDGSARVIVYGHHGCGLARMLAEALAEHHLDHEWRDVVEGEPRFREELRRLARGYLSEPSPREVLRKLSSHQPGLVERLLRR